MDGWMDRKFWQPASFYFEEDGFILKETVPETRISMPSILCIKSFKCENIPRLASTYDTNKCELMFGGILYRTRVTNPEQNSHAFLAGLHSYLIVVKTQVVSQQTYYNTRGWHRGLVYQWTKVLLEKQWNSSVTSELRPCGWSCVAACCCVQGHVSGTSLQNLRFYKKVF